MSDEARQGQEAAQEDSSEQDSRPRGLVDVADRAAAAGVEAEWRRSGEDDSYLVLHFPNGRTTRRLPVFDGSRREESLAQIDLSNYTFLGDYEAIASYNNHYIEAGLTGLGRQFAYLPGIEKIPSVPSEQSLEQPPSEGELLDSEADEEAGPTEQAKAAFRLSVSNPEIPWRLEVSPASVAFLGLSRSTYFRETKATTLKILGVALSTHDGALDVLETVSDSFFFDLELRYNLLVNLQRPRPRRQGLMRRRTEVPAGPPQLPKTSYPREPLALYWYARSATGMPLLQYLAYYQSIEFFFSIHSRGEALTRLRNELRDPRFDLQNDSDLSRILSIATASGGGFGSEREQLKVTLRACIDANRLRDFLTTEPKVQEHFTGRQEIRSLQRIRLADLQADLRDQVANRIYDLRCRIVHTKDEPDSGAAGLLLPYSKEANSLAYDIELIKFASQKVLIAGSSALAPQYSSNTARETDTPQPSEE